MRQVTSIDTFTDHGVYAPITCQWSGELELEVNGFGVSCYALYNRRVEPLLHRPAPMRAPVRVSAACAVQPRCGACGDVPAELSACEQSDTLLCHQLQPLSSAIVDAPARVRG